MKKTTAASPISGEQPLFFSGANYELAIMS